MVSIEQGYLDTKQLEAIVINMKTTITLDTEVEQRLREAMQRQGKSLKEILNEALRRGLGLSQQQFEVKSRPLRLRPGLDPARPSDLDDDLEVEEFLSKTARLNKRKG